MKNLTFSVSQLINCQHSKRNKNFKKINVSGLKKISVIYFKKIKKMFYEGYHFGGTHLIGWFVWAILLFWIFATPYDIPYQRKSSALDILQKRFASGQIDKEQYQEHEAILEQDLVK